MVKEKWNTFWNQDTDTIIYTVMCIVTIPAIVIGLFYLWLVETRLPEGAGVCVFRMAAGFYCPGCGGTRAFQELFRADLPGAVYYHPAAVYGVGLYLTYFISQTLMRISKGKLWGMKLKPIYLYLMLGLMVINFMVRNILLLFFDIPTL